MPNQQFEKVTFNGVSRQITVNNGVSSLDIAIDVYSAWVRWASQNRAFTFAMRYTGYDAIPGGRTGATFFLLNGWKLLLDLKSTRVSGVLFSDNYETPYYDTTTQMPLYSTQVSSVVNTVYASGVSADAVWTHPTRTLTDASIVRGALPELDKLDVEVSSRSNLTAAQVWEYSLRNLTTSGAMTPEQAMMLLELYKIHGLLAGSPLTVTDSSRTSEGIAQSINSDNNRTVVTRL